MASKLFGRCAAIIANDGKEQIEIECVPGQPGIQIRAEVQIAADGTPSEADVEILNLKESTRAFFNRKNVNITLKAGYIGELKQIFKGNVEIPGNEHGRTEWVTKLHCKGGGASLRTLTVSKTWKKGTDVTVIINHLLDRLTLSPAIQDQFKEINALAKGKILLQGFKPKTQKTVRKKTNKQAALPSVEQQKRDYLKKRAKLAGESEARKIEKAKTLRGAAWDKLVYLCKSQGLTLNEHGQTINIYPDGLAMDQNVIILDPTSGLIGSPERVDKGYKVVYQLIADIVPGRLVSIASKYLQSACLVYHTVFKLDTTGAGEFTGESHVQEYAL